jgi:hypothetical protein
MSKRLKYSLTAFFFLVGVIAAIVLGGIFQINLRVNKFVMPGKYQVQLAEDQTAWAVWYFWRWRSKGFDMTPYVRPKISLKKSGVPISLESFHPFNNDYKMTPEFYYDNNGVQGALMYGATLKSGTYTIQSDTPGVVVLENTGRVSHELDGQTIPTGISDDNNFVKGSDEHITR